MTSPIISDDEFRTRIERLQTAVAEAKLDGVLVFSTECEPAGVRYFSDYWPSFETTAVLAPRDGEPVLLIGPESGTFARARSKIERIVRMRDFRESSQPDYPGAKLTQWRELLGEMRIERLGIAGWHAIPHSIFAGIAAVLGPENVVEADGLVRAITVRKSPAELDCLREAARISELGLAAVLESIRPHDGNSACGIAAARCSRKERRQPGTDLVLQRPQLEQAISRPTHRRYKREIIHFSVAERSPGYSASIGRPFLGHCPQGDAPIRAGWPRCRKPDVRPDARRIAGLRGRNQGPTSSPTVDMARRSSRPAHGCGQMEEFPPETSSDFRLEPGMVFMVDVFEYVADGLPLGRRASSPKTVRNNSQPLKGS